MSPEKGRKKKKRKFYDPILPGTKDWPIVQLSKNRKQFIEEVVEETFASVKQITKGRLLKEDLELTVYKERLRIKRNPWKVDPADEASFWNGIQKELIHHSTSNTQDKEVHDQVLHQIIARYANEIAGDFRRSNYRFARAMVTFGFARLLNASRIKGIASLWSRQLDLDDKIHIVGHTEHVRKLAKIGTVVIVPTHFSNLDSILIGWVIQFLGLPPFIYGAGLNLFNIRIFAYFMNSLGAYKVDRRKKNLIYLETLKTYSRVAIRRGCHSLFFPGGTRSRSGRLETSLKTGLLNTTIEALRHNYQHPDQGGSQKIFIVPVVLNYNFVLEAPQLINDYLKREGQERYYVENDEYSTSYRITKFLIEFFTKGSDISVSIGKGMDVFGNYVDDEGNSYDQSGHLIDLSDYFRSNGKINYDKQRESQYTMRMAERIVEEFHTNNRVFASHLVAFTAFELIKKHNEKIDLYDIFRLPVEEIVIPYEEFKKAFKRLRKRIFKLKKEGQVQHAHHLKGDADEVITFGIKNCGMYHTTRPLLKNDAGDIISQDLNKLFYYHNRLEGYGLDKFV